MSLADDFIADAGPQAKAAPSGSLADQFIQDAAVAPSANTKSQTGASGSWANAGASGSWANPVTPASKMLQGVADPVEGGAQLLTHLLPSGVVNAGNSFNNLIADKTGLVSPIPAGGMDALVSNNEKTYQADRKAAGESGFDGYRVIGNILSPANLALASKLPTAATTMGRIAAGAMGGGVSAALNPVTSGDFWSNKGNQVATGAAIGGIMAPVASAVSRLISPNASNNADVNLLKSQGVQPTIGQTLGGWANAAEEKLQSVPILGDAIAAARMRARDQFNNAAINRAVAPIGQRVEGGGQEAVTQAGDLLSQAYTRGKNAMGNFRIDPQGNAELQNLQQMVQTLPPKEQGVFNSMWQKFQGELTPNGSLLADGYKRIDSALGSNARQFSGSQDAYQKQLGDALSEFQRVITDSGRRANPQAAQILDAADAGWSNLVRIEGASKAAMNSKGVFTPAQLNMAARQADTSVRDRATARGTALMQDLASAGQSVIGNKVPDSGTAGRLLTPTGIGALLGGYAYNPMIPAGILTGAAAYTPPMQSILRGLLSSRPQGAETVSDALRQAAPLLAPAGAQIGLGLLNQ